MEIDQKNLETEVTEEKAWKKNWKEDLHPKIDEFLTVLKDQETDWNQRKTSLAELAEFFVANQKSTDALEDLFRELIPCLKSQLEDRRSSLCKEACQTLTVLANTIGPLFEKHSTACFNILFSLLPVTIKVIQESANQCISSIVCNANESIPFIVENSTHTHPSIRKYCAVYLTKMLESNPKSSYEKYVDYIEKGLSTMICDATEETRQNAKKGILQYKKLFPEQAEKLISALPASAQKIINTSAPSASAKPNFREFLAQKKTQQPVAPAMPEDAIVVVSKPVVEPPKVETVVTTTTTEAPSVSTTETKKESKKEEAPAEKKTEQTKAEQKDEEMPDAEPTKEKIPEKPTKSVKKADSKDTKPTTKQASKPQAPTKSLKAPETKPVAAESKPKKEEEPKKNFASMTKSAKAKVKATEEVEEKKPKKTSANKENIVDNEQPAKKTKTNRHAYLLEYDPGNTPIARRTRSTDKKAKK